MRDTITHCTRHPACNLKACHSVFYTWALLFDNDLHHHIHKISVLVEDSLNFARSIEMAEYHGGVISSQNTIRCTSNGPEISDAQRTGAQSRHGGGLSSWTQINLSVRTLPDLGCDTRESVRHKQPMVQLPHWFLNQIISQQPRSTAWATLKSKLTANLD